MTIKLAVVGDPLDQFKPQKDTTLRLMLEAQSKNWQVSYLELADLSIRDGIAWGSARPVTLRDSATNWFDADAAQPIKLQDFDLLFMRKDPPFDLEFVNATHILELAQKAGLTVVNDPRGLRDIGEKLSIAQFPQFCPPTLISRDMQPFRDFLTEHENIVMKPLDGMGGASIFRVSQDDQNASVIFETLTELETRYAMAQRYIPDITAGDKRILVIDGQPYEHALARIPAKGELRGNLAAGGRGEGVDLSDRDYEIATTIGQWLKDRGMLFCGLDVIGDSLTEINVTSPTCVRELEAIYGDNIAGRILDAAAAQLDR